jgi:hypothetical protein
MIGIDERLAEGKMASSEVSRVLLLFKRRKKALVGDSNKYLS